ncbi:MAG: HepT-like ribonuclease domain-containing protein [Phormidesmis sp.]
MTEQRDVAHLRYISDCAALIRDYTSSGKSEFMSNILLQDAVLRRLQTMAESTQRLSEDLKVKAPEVDWRALAGFRNILAHNYLNGIDLERVWDAIENYLPGLEKAVRELRKITDIRKE